MVSVWEQLEDRICTGFPVLCLADNFEDIYDFLLAISLLPFLQPINYSCSSLLLGGQRLLDTKQTILDEVVSKDSVYVWGQVSQKEAMFIVELVELC